MKYIFILMFLIFATSLHAKVDIFSSLGPCLIDKDSYSEFLIEGYSLTSIIKLDIKTSETKIKYSENSCSFIFVKGKKSRPNPKADIFSSHGPCLIHDESYNEFLEDGYTLHSVIKLDEETHIGNNPIKRSIPAGTCSFIWVK